MRLPSRPPLLLTTMTAVSLLGLLAGCNQPADAPAAGAAASAAVASASGVSGAAGAASAPGAAASAPPVGITTVRAQVRDLPVLITATGTVAPLSSVDIRPQTTSLITKVHVKEGQFVKAGELLFTLDTRADEANVAKARAQLARDEAALADAQRQFKRSQELLAQNFISQGALDTSQTNVQSQAAAVAADKAAVDAAQLGLSYTRIKAPSAGRLGAINVFPGSSVQANTTTLVSLTQLDPIAVSFGLPQRHLADALAALKDGGAPVSALPPESASTPGGSSQAPVGLAAMGAASGAGRGEKSDKGERPDKSSKPDGAEKGERRAKADAAEPAGSAAAARAMAAPGRPEGAASGAGEGGARAGRGGLAQAQALKGRLKFVDNAVDPSSGTVKVKAVFDNAANKLWPGAFVNVSLTASVIKGAIIIPQAAIVQSARGTLVFAVVDGKAVSRPVQVLYAQGEEAAVSGLKPGERIVMDGRQNVRPGASVVERPREGGGKGGKDGKGGPAGTASGAASGADATTSGGASSVASPPGSNGKGAPAP